MGRPIDDGRRVGDRPKWPRLSELTAPLRRLAKKDKRFLPTSEHHEAFAAAKAHLLDEDVNCIRMPSPDPADSVVLWTDSSSNSLSCLLTQLMEPLKPDASG